ncbi:MAG: site-2 protease family protein [Oscillospiraceae bacterium]|nr:site-2 protease family protein [Oscillospiraceae bacterium]
MKPISGIKTVWEGLDFSYLLSIILAVIPSLICITLHELSHGLVAYRLGDDTAKNAGRLTLNPLRHLDPMGLLMMVVFRFGWAKPVPVNMFRFKNPKRGMAITALAGPLSNVVITLVFLLLYGALYIPLEGSAAGEYFLEMLELTAYISLGFAVFNMLPFPPLDGSKVLFSLMSDEGYRKLMRYERYGSLALLLLVWTGILGRPLSTAVRYLYRLLVPLAQWACDGVYSIFYK